MTGDNVSESVSRRRILRIGGGLVVIGGVGSSAAASSDHEPTDRLTDARIRVAHLSPDAPNVDVYVDGVPVLEDVPYRAVSDYLDLEPGTYTIRVVPAGEDPAEAVLEETVEVVDGDYTIAVIGEVAAENQPLQTLVLEDDDGPVDPDTARIRVVHASPDAPAVDVVAGENGDALFENVEFGESGYTDVPKGEYTLVVYPASDRETGVFETDVSLAGGTVYSAFAIGYLEAETAPVDEPFEVLLTDDREEPRGIEEKKQKVKEALQELKEELKEASEG